MGTIGDRCRQRRKEIELSQQALAKLAGVSQATISGIETGRAIETRKLMRVAKALKVDPDWFETGLGEKTIAPAKALYTINQEAKVYLAKNKIPMINWMDASEVKDATDLMEHQVNKWIYSPIDIQEGSYALRVDGISMQPEFKRGAIIFVDPNIPPENEKFLVVKRPVDVEAILRELFIESGKKYLKAINPAFPDQIFELTKDIKVCGVVVGQWIAY